MKYHARFTGRTKGAIGIFYPIQCFVEGYDDHAAHVALYADYEHISGLRLLALTERYVATYIDRDGQRKLMGASQGRNTYATPEDAQTWLDAVVANTDGARLRDLWGSDPRFAVRPVWCWPGHFDPIGTYVDA